MKAALLFLLGAAVAGACAPAAPRAVEIRIHYSHYSTTQIDVPAGDPELQKFAESWNAPGDPRADLGV